MPAPRLTIDQLPEDTALGGAEWLIIQDSGTSKKVAVSAIVAINQSALDAHLNSADAHDAVAVSATASSATVNGPNVQSQLGQIVAELAALADRVTALETP